MSNGEYDTWHKYKDIFLQDGFTFEIVQKIADLSYCYLWDLYYLFKHGREIPDGGIFFEIGAHVGGSMITVAEGAKSAGKKIQLMTIEPFWETPPEKEEEFKINTRDYPHILYKDFSFNVHPKITDNSVDLLFIDGSHDYERVCEDIVNFWPKLRIGGVLLGHDFDFGYVMYGERNKINDGVVEAVLDKLRLQEIIKLRMSSVFKVIKTSENLQKGVL